MVTLGIERLLAAPPKYLEGKRLGLLCNHASIGHNFIHSRQLIRQVFSDKLTCLLSPQHGFFAEKQDNMVESDHAIDPLSGLPIYSLYSRQRKPTPAMLDQFDVLLVDLPDVGTRVYTFLYSLAYCLDAAKASDKMVVVLDRPNPIGGLQMEGNLLKENCTSFVGLYPLPMRHGMTLGELALMINDRFRINAKLEVIPMKGWERHMYFRETGLPWVFPSPNIPTPESAIVYPGQVIWEGTNVSEGRGTTLPFELFGAPFIDPQQLLEFSNGIPLPGCVFRPVSFEPTSNKWANTVCRGFHIHVTDVKAFQPYRTSLALLQGVMLHYPEDFKYKQPPYEYEYDRLPLDLILGDMELRTALTDGTSLLELEAQWQDELGEFKQIRQRYLLYN